MVNDIWEYLGDDVWVLSKPWFPDYGRLTDIYWISIKYVFKYINKLTVVLFL